MCRNIIVVRLTLVLLPRQHTFFFIDPRLRSGQLACMVQTRRPQERRPPASRDFVDSPIVIKSGKKGNKNAPKPKSGAQNALQSIDAPRHIKLILGKKKCTEVNCDEVSTIKTPDSLGEYSQVDNGDSGSQSLPSNINVEVTIMVRGGIQGQPDQDIIDPDMTFAEFRLRIRRMVEDNYSAFADTNEISMAWKWEKRVMVQTGVKKMPTPWSVLSRDRNWNAVQQVLRESAAKKNGTHNMLLKIQATIVDADTVLPQTETSVPTTGRQVLKF